MLLNFSSTWNELPKNQNECCVVGPVSKGSLLHILFPDWVICTIREGCMKKLEGMVLSTCFGRGYYGIYGQSPCISWHKMWSSTFLCFSKCVLMYSLEFGLLSSLNDIFQRNFEHCLLTTSPSNNNMQRLFKTTAVTSPSLLSPPHLAPTWSSPTPHRDP